jgi:hypothetical protein
MESGMNGQKMNEDMNEEMNEENKQKPGNASQLLVGINSGLNQLGEIIYQSKLPEEDKKRFDILMQTFMAFADSLGQAQGQGKAKTGNVPVETMGRPAVQAM